MIDQIWVAKDAAWIEPTLNKENTMCMDIYSVHLRNILNYKLLIWKTWNLTFGTFEIYSFVVNKTMLK